MMPLQCNIGIRGPRRRRGPFLLKRLLNYIGLHLWYNIHVYLSLTILYEQSTWQQKSAHCRHYYFAGNRSLSLFHYLVFTSIYLRCNYIGIHYFFTLFI
jgi:hypothetical protein